jgi:YHS domain-containing protein
MSRHAHLAASLTCLVLAGVSWAQEDRRTLTSDAVELVSKGVEVEGKSEHSLKRGKHTYWFACAENKKAFEQTPDRFEIQWGGACARMGPLSGEGWARIHAVHDGKLYIFASDPCKKAFVTSPEKFVEGTDPVPTPTADEAKRGREIMDRALLAHGGKDPIAKVSSYRWRVIKEGEHNGQPTTESTSTLVVFPTSVRGEATWNEFIWADVATGSGGFSLSKDSVEDLASTQIETLRRNAARHLAVILHAATQRDAVLQGLPKDKDGAEQVRVALWGATSTLTLDAKTGRVVGVAYRGRGPSLSMGDVALTFDDFAPVEGILLPRKEAGLFDGKPSKGLTREGISHEVNLKDVARQFERANPAN